jgi:hypothetical protein
MGDQRQGGTCNARPTENTIFNAVARLSIVQYGDCINVHNLQSQLALCKVRRHKSRIASSLLQKVRNRRAEGEVGG